MVRKVAETGKNVVIMVDMTDVSSRCKVVKRISGEDEGDSDVFEEYALNHVRV